jgi:hypothetical protein
VYILSPIHKVDGITEKIDYIERRVLGEGQNIGTETLRLRYEQEKMSRERRRQGQKHGRL